MGKIENKEYIFLDQALIIIFEKQLMFKKVDQFFYGIQYYSSQAYSKSHNLGDLFLDLKIMHHDNLSPNTRPHCFTLWYLVLIPFIGLDFNNLI